MGRELRLQLPEEGAAGERHTVLAGYLRREPLQLDVADVAALQAGAGIDIEFLFASGLLDGNQDADAHAFIVERRPGAGRADAARRAGFRLEQQRDDEPGQFPGTSRAARWTSAWSLPVKLVLRSGRKSS